MSANGCRISGKCHHHLIHCAAALRRPDKLLHTCMRVREDANFSPVNLKATRRQQVLLYLLHKRSARTWSGMSFVKKSCWCWCASSHASFGWHKREQQANWHETLRIDCLPNAFSCARWVVAWSCRWKSTLGRGRAARHRGPFGAASTATWFGTLSGKRRTARGTRRCGFLSAASASSALWTPSRIEDIEIPCPGCAPAEERNRQHVYRVGEAMSLLGHS